MEHDDVHADPTIFFGHQYAESHVSNPDWTDLPTIPNTINDEVTVAFLERIPGVLENASRKRYAVFTELASQYARYRQARCRPEISRIEAIKRTAETEEVSVEAVYDHVRSFYDDQDAAYLESLTEDLEAAWTTAGPTDKPLYERVRTVCDQLLPVLRMLADIEDTPPLRPSEISLQEIHDDQPGKREHILSSERNVSGIPSSGSRESGASVSPSQPELHDTDPEAREDTTYLSDDATVYTRDISLYDTDYSTIFRRICSVMQEELYLSGAKIDPVIGPGGDDNAALSATLPDPREREHSAQRLAQLRVKYWESGDSQVRVDIHPLPDRIRLKKDPSISGPLDSLTTPSIHTFLGGAMRQAVTTTQLERRNA